MFIEIFPKPKSNSIRAEAERLHENPQTVRVVCADCKIDAIVPGDDPVRVAISIPNEEDVIIVAGNQEMGATTFYRYYPHCGAIVPLGLLWAYPTRAEINGIAENLSITENSLFICKERLYKITSVGIDKLLDKSEAFILDERIWPFFVQITDEEFVLHRYDTELNEATICQRYLKSMFEELIDREDFIDFVENQIGSSKKRNRRIKI